MKFAESYWAVLIFVFLGNNAFSQIANYKHEGYTIHHFNKNTEHHKLVNKPALQKSENYKTNGFLFNKHIADTLKKRNHVSNQNCLVIKEHYKVQFKPHENANPQNITDSSKLMADKGGQLLK